MTSSILKANLRTKFAALAGGVLSALLAHGAITVNMASPSSGDGVTLEGNVVALTRDGGTYRLSGTTGSYAVRCDADLTLVFDDSLELTSPKSDLPAIDLNGHVVTIDSNGSDAKKAEIKACSNGSSRGAIEVNDGSTLIVNGGWFSVSGRDTGAAIGSKSKTKAGAVIINGGTVDAAMLSGGANGLGAVIGSGYDADGGMVRITGGSVTVAPKEWGAGIGTGTTHQGSGVPRSIGLIEITGGTVTVNGALNGGAPIGGGHGNTNSKAGAGGGEIRLLGGTVHVIHPCDNTTAAYPSAAIGGGNYGGAGAAVTVDVAATVTIELAEKSCSKAANGDYVAFGSAKVGTTAFAQGSLAFTNRLGLDTLRPFLSIVCKTDATYGGDYLEGGTDRPTRIAREGVDVFLCVRSAGGGYLYCFDPKGETDAYDVFVSVGRPATADGVSFGGGVITLTDATKRYLVFGETTENVLAIDAETAEAPLALTLFGASVESSSKPTLDLGSSAVAITLAAGTESSFRVTGGSASAIQVNAPAALAIDGTGALTAEGCGEGGGIASADKTAFGTLEIAGGTVTAVSPDGYRWGMSGKKAAAIGSGWGGAGGTIRITGGTVTARSWLWSAGIGQGACYQASEQPMGTVEISGRDTVVTAYGGADGGAGIGGGHGVSAESGGMTGGTISITDGATVYACAGKKSSGTCGAAIGAGNGGATEPDITIDVSAKVFLDANGAADIGSVNGTVHGTLTITKAEDEVVSHAFLSGTKANPCFAGPMTVAFDQTLRDEIESGVAAITQSGLAALYIVSAEAVDVANPRADSTRYTWNAQDNTITLTDATGSEPLKVLGTTTANRIVVAADGCTLELCGTSITGVGAPIDVNGHALAVRLADGTVNTLSGAANFPAIRVEGEGAVTIEGTGALQATGGSAAAGIGSCPEVTAGKIVIDGGAITVTTTKGASGRSGAAIGGGDRASGGTVIVNGGTLVATGVDWSPAIGSGSAYNTAVHLCPGTVKIYGGDLTLKGGKDGGAAIGGGHPKAAGNAEYGSQGGVCEIWGGTVRATSAGSSFDGHGMPVIGGGSSGDGMTVLISTAADVTLTAGAIKGGTYHPEIGRGYFSLGSPAVGSLTIYRDPATENGKEFLRTTATDVLDGVWAGEPIYAAADGEEFFAGDVLRMPLGAGFVYSFFRGDLAWSGEGTDANWSTAANWTDTLKVGEMNERMTFGVSAETNPVNDLAGVSVRNLKFAADAPSYVLAGEQTLTVASSIVSEGSAAQTFAMPIAASGDLGVSVPGGVAFGSVVGAGSLMVGSSAVTVADGRFAGDLDLGNLSGSYVGNSFFAGGIRTVGYTDGDDHLVTVSGTNTFGDLYWPYPQGDHVFLTIPAGSSITADSWKASQSLAAFVHGELTIHGDIEVERASGLRGDGGTVRIGGEILSRNGKGVFDFHLTGHAFIRGGRPVSTATTVYAPTTIHPWDADVTYACEMALNSYDGKDGNLTFDTTGLDGEGHLVVLSGPLYRSGGNKDNQSMTVTGTGTFRYTGGVKSGKALDVPFGLTGGTLELFGKLPQTPLAVSAGRTLALKPDGNAALASVTLPEEGRVTLRVVTDGELEEGVYTLLDTDAQLTAADLAKIDLVVDNLPRRQAASLLSTGDGDLRVRITRRGLLFIVR